MLGDATGHGLAASISALPVLTAFYSLVEQSFPLGFIAYEVNRQLMAYMPTGRFVAASLVCLDERDGSADLWVGGMPDVLLLEADGTVRRNIASTHLALGIVDFDESMAGIEHIACPPGGQLVLMSDGLLEATNADGQAFGVARLKQALRGPSSERLAAVRDALSQHLGSGGVLPHDDISLLLIDC
jgi:serine phosphatase RsbU (regulator of sigma subunit)